MISEPVAVVFGTLLHDLDEDWPGRNQLVLAMRHERTVVLLGRARGGRRALIRPFPRVHSHHDGVLRVSNAFAVSGRPKLAWLAKPLARIEGYLLRRLLARHGVGRYLVWLTNPGYHLAEGRGPNRYVYDCADPSFRDDHDAEFDRAEERDVRSADLVLATSHILLERVSRWHGSAHLVPNATARYDAGSAWSPWPAAKVAGYVGTVDARFDAGAVADAAAALGDWEFVIVGRVNNPDDAGVRRLLELSNVQVTGQVSETVAQQHLSRFTLGLIPFTPRLMNDAINSVKMFDYLAYGMPVVSLATEESHRNVHVTVAAAPAQLADTIVRTHESDRVELQFARRSWAAGNTWDVRAAEVTALITKKGLFT